METLERSRLAWPLSDTEIRVQTTRLPPLQTLPKYRRPALTELRTLLIAALLHVALIVGAALTPRPQRPGLTDSEHQRRWALALGPALRPGTLVLDEFFAARKMFRCALDRPPRAPQESQLLRFDRPRAPLDRHSLEHALAMWTPPKAPGQAEGRRRRPPRTLRSPKTAGPARPPKPHDPTGSSDIFPPDAGGAPPGMSAPDQAPTPDPSGTNRVIACAFGPRGTDAQAAASSAIRSHLRRIRYCYERALTRAAPDLAGTIVLKLELQNTRLHKARIVENSLHDAQTEACVLRVLKTISYPEYRSEQIRQARYPITFESR